MTSAPFSDGLRVPALPWSRIMAAVVWSIAVYPTYLAVATFNLAAWLAWTAAIGGQGLLTLLESPIWRPNYYDEEGDALPRPRTLLHWFAMAMDVLINVSGTWAVVKQLHTLAPIQAIGEMFNWTVPPITGWVALVTSLALGFFLAAAPEVLYHMD